MYFLILKHYFFLYFVSYLSSFMFSLMMIAVSGAQEVLAMF